MKSKPANQSIRAAESGAAGSTASDWNAEGKYRWRLASGESDVRAAQLLRFMVFNLELQEGLEQSFHTCLDADRFDPVCDHLLVECVPTGEVVGTYRLQTGATAARAQGYYSAQEFDFDPYESIREKVIELGRACVHKDHRSFAVLNLLWKGIAAYAGRHGGRYLIGCSSLTSQDQKTGASAYEKLRPYLAPEHLQTRPLARYVCSLAEKSAVATKIPKLLGAYLMFGARICGPPAIDHEFKTIDFLTLLDLQSLPAPIALRYLGTTFTT